MNQSRSLVPVSRWWTWSRPEVTIGIEGWHGFRPDPAVFDGPDAQIADLFYGEAAPEGEPA